MTKKLKTGGGIQLLLTATAMVVVMGTARVTVTITITVPGSGIILLVFIVLRVLNSPDVQEGGDPEVEDRYEDDGWGAEEEEEAGEGVLEECGEDAEGAAEGAGGG